MLLEEAALRASANHALLRRVFGSEELNEPLGLDLRPEHQARYERVRARKLRRVREGLAEGEWRSAGARIGLRGNPTPES